MRHLTNDGGRLTVWGELNPLRQSNMITGISVFLISSSFHHILLWSSLKVQNLFFTYLECVNIKLLRYFCFEISAKGCREFHTWFLTVLKTAFKKKKKSAATTFSESILLLLWRVHWRHCGSLSSELLSFKETASGKNVGSIFCTFTGTSLLKKMLLLLRDEKDKN